MEIFYDCYKSDAGKLFVVLGDKKQSCIGTILIWTL
jgi:hypothetical protein